MKKLVKLLEFAKEHIVFMQPNQIWENTWTPNDIDRPVYIKKWSNCGNKLVFKLNAQVAEASQSSTDSEDNWVKVLQIVTRNANEIILKYNAGTADLVGEGIITMPVTDECRRVIFSNKTTLKQKIDSLEKLFKDAKRYEVESVANKPRRTMRNKSYNRKSKSLIFR